MYANFRLHFRSVLLVLAAALLVVCCGVVLCSPSAARRSGEDPALSTKTLPKSETRTLPVLMYHSVCDHPTKKSVYILSPAVFAEDLKYLKAHGYETVFLSEVLSFAAGEGTLPEKPVVITFDDGCLNALTNALPLLREVGMRAEINIVGEYAQNAASEAVRSPNYSYLTWEEVRQLQASGCFEIGCHTYAMHTLSPRNGCAQKRGESDDAYRAALAADVSAMRDAMLREKINATVIFAFPFGAVSAHTREYLQSMGFTVFLTCRESLNDITSHTPLAPLGRFNRTSALSTEAFMRQVGIG